ncbi:MAG: 16S rRNA (cytosine(1402)-N(4))-methyltransferase RsmH [Ruminococcaceae bacterium]|nr:16S rRNA (cytosine(1402)-N(4))-methyltransferase RsmH [Oscillospiraceae bacterium]
MSQEHKPVLFAETIELLDIRPDGIYVDGTLGRAGHASAILSRLGKDGRLVGIDKDHEAIAAAEKVFTRDARVTLVRADFRNIADVLKEAGVDRVDGILLDLGVSSPQLDDASRGFSYMADAPLDMRMDRRQSYDAYELVNFASEEELKRILWDYGEERYAPKIARKIVEEREKTPIETTLALVEIIKRAMPAAALREKQHPAKRSFQAFRIAVNDELGAIADVLEDAVDALNPHGRLAVITFHSLEDRIVKQAFKKMENPCTCPKEFPVCVCGKTPLITSVTKKPVTASERELTENPRARSAKLRVAEKR